MHTIIGLINILLTILMWKHFMRVENIKESFYKYIFSNLLTPKNFKISSSHLAKYSIKIYKGDMINYIFDKGKKWLSIDFGEAFEVCYHFKQVLKIIFKLIFVELIIMYQFSQHLF